MKLTQKQYKSFMLGLAMGRKITTVEKTDDLVEQEVTVSKKESNIKLDKDKESSSTWFVGGNGLIFAGGVYGGSSSLFYYESYINKISGASPSQGLMGYFKIYVDGEKVGETESFKLQEGSNKVKAEAELNIGEEVKKGKIGYELVIEKDKNDENEYEVVSKEYGVVISTETKVERDKVGEIPIPSWVRDIVSKIRRIRGYVDFSTHRQISEKLDLVIIETVGKIVDTATIRVHKQVSKNGKDNVRVVDYVDFSTYNPNGSEVITEKEIVEVIRAVKDKAGLEVVRVVKEEEKDVVRVVDYVEFSTYNPSKDSSNEILKEREVVEQIRVVDGVVIEISKVEEREKSESIRVVDYVDFSTE